MVSDGAMLCPMLAPTHSGQCPGHPWEYAMPTISMFYGILVMMYFRDNIRHHLPHIHVRYQDDEAVLSIDDGALLEGNLPRKQLKLVQAWIEIHQEDLMLDWQLAVKGEEPFRIAPLQ